MLQEDQMKIKLLAGYVSGRGAKIERHLLLAMLLPPPHPLLPGSKLHRQIHAPASLHALRTESAINPFTAKSHLIELQTLLSISLTPHFIVHLDPADCNHRVFALPSFNEECFKKELDRHQTVQCDCIRNGSRLKAGQVALNGNKSLQSPPCGRR